MQFRNYGGVVKSRDDIKSMSRKRGNGFPESLCKAIDKMQEDGFITELWMDKNTSSVMFRWVKGGSKWHVTAKGVRLLKSSLEEIGKNALHWCKARENNMDREENYAVRES